MAACAMTVDLEDYFQVSAFSQHSPLSQWDEFDCRVEKNTHTLLDLFARYDVKATFFILGWIAERYPDLIRTIALQGHEIASHGYHHQRVTSLSQEAFLEDISRSKALLENITGSRVIGYRAPSFSFNNETPWVYDCLVAAGYQYSSSVYPVQHDHYGSPLLPRFAFHSHSQCLEIPISTLKMQWGSVFNKNVPIGGGGYFRFYPQWLSLWFLKQFHRQEQQPYIFYIHPWELDPHQPRLFDVGIKTRFRHYVNLDKTYQRLERLLQLYQWQRMDQLFTTSISAAIEVSGEQALA
ncbi:XrtA system polysaccharide deacetylase [Motilimonas pumila]|uniref:DUF3473 domain-containing protein n=1 Tax=Motilimonas pumila TaxID=2303987 RepID=A0A418YHE2_9GAMM|nr:XrtA system polysaccharide deacetylase [Motilimonas pumila]RJG49464.1 DUF3473 domain-containing protein [Motilimonas pumila]